MTESKRRTAIQITVVPQMPRRLGSAGHALTLFALCDDGTLWENSAAFDESDSWYGWVPVPDIPQGDLP